MAPKEKAEELVERYSIFAWNENLFDSDIAKKCALMVVDDIIKSNMLLDEDDFSSNFIDDFKTVKDWQKVKAEIESL